MDRREVLRQSLASAGGMLTSLVYVPDVRMGVKFRVRDDKSEVDRFFEGRSELGIEELLNRIKDTLAEVWEAPRLPLGYKANIKEEMRNINRALNFGKELVSEGQVVAFRNAYDEAVEFEVDGYTCPVCYKTVDLSDHHDHKVGDIL